MGSTPEKGARTLIYLAEENKSHLISGEYYYKKSVKKITPQSYNMKVAGLLLEKLGDYLKDYLVWPFLIFEIENKKSTLKDKYQTELTVR